MNTQNQNRIETAIWGVAPGDKHEQLLAGRIYTQEDKDRILELAKTHGFTKVRIQTIDLSVVPDFGKMFAATVNL